MKVIKMEVGFIGTNCYLVINEATKHAVVIDPGGDGPLILDTVAKEGAIVDAIFLTHGHSDHIMALDEVRNATGAKVYISKEDASMLGDAAANLSAFMGMNGVFDAADTCFTEGVNVTEAGMNFQIVATPGHTPGGVCIINGDTVFCGDTIFAESIGRTDFPGGSYPLILNSIHTKILTLPDETKLLPGHGPATTVGWERRRNPFLQK